MLKKIEDRQNEKRIKFDPLQTVKKGIFKWIIILCHGGKFCLQVMLGAQTLMTRSDSKYVIRAKSGGR